MWQHYKCNYGSPKSDSLWLASSAKTAGGSRHNLWWMWTKEWVSFAGIRHSQNWKSKY